MLRRRVLGRATDDADVLLMTHIHADGSEAEILWTECSGARAPSVDPREAMAELGPVLAAT